MNNDAADRIRNILDRLRAQVEAHLPQLAHRHGQPNSEEMIPLDRLPLVGSCVQQLVEAEAVFANAMAPEGEHLDGDQSNG